MYLTFDMSKGKITATIILVNLGMWGCALIGNNNTDWPTDIKY